MRLKRDILVRLSRRVLGKELAGRMPAAIAHRGAKSACKRGCRGVRARTRPGAWRCCGGAAAPGDRAVYEGQRAVRPRGHARGTADAAGGAGKAAGLPLHVIDIPYPCPNADYERIMGAFVAKRRRAWPRWRSAICFWPTSAPIASASLLTQASRRCFRYGARNTRALAVETHGGRAAHATCVDPRGSSALCVCRAQVHSSVSWPTCRTVSIYAVENGEFHTFVCAGLDVSQWQRPIHTGDVVERDGFDIWVHMASVG